jgi:Zn-dependent M16 (insulinase) family peptidase
MRISSLLHSLTFPLHLSLLLNLSPAAAMLLRQCPKQTWRHTFLPQSSRLASQSRIAAYHRGFASVARDVLSKPGDSLHGFTVEQVQAFPELELEAWKLRHDKTGAEYLHLKRDDPNNVFAIGFKTNPPDATGVPHILEHTTLCGSKKYPVRDPFFKMLPRSFANYQNAFTSSDYTVYPFATTNVQDYKNLMSVYMDATLHPILNKNDFLQEGWRIGPKKVDESAENKDGNELEFKGVVYNEMKGMMSDTNYLFYVRFHEHLIPRLNNSGGDPAKITDLTHEQLRKFHADHYHPSNAKIFTYGNIPLEDNVEQLVSPLNGFGSSPADVAIFDPTEFSEPIEVEVEGPVDELTEKDKQYKTSISWIVADNKDLVTRFSFGVISNLLLSGFGSPMYRALIESRLGDSFAPNNGFIQAGTKSVFSLGAVGVEAGNVRKVKDVIYETLAEVQERGFDKAKVDGILHQLELSLKHKSASFGMSMMNRVLQDWFNSVDPVKLYGVQKLIDEFKTRYAEPRYLENLLKNAMLNNKTMTFTMIPNADFSKKQAQEEEARLTAKIADVTSKLSDGQNATEFLAAQENKLLQEQGTEQDLSVLPSLSVSDIERVKPVKEIKHSAIGDVKIQWREAPTNGITYFRAINTFKNLPEELRELVPLFADCISRIGTKDMSMEQLEERMKLTVGDVSVGYYSATSISDTKGWEEGFKFVGYAMDRNVPAMFDMFNKLVLETDFDSPQAEDNIRELLQMSAVSTSDAITEQGHSYASRFAKSTMTPEAAAMEKTTGLYQLKLMIKLSQQKSLTEIIQKLKTIQQLALSNNGTMRVRVTCGQESRQSNEKNLSEFLSSRPTFSQDLKSSSTDLIATSSPKTFIQMPIQVSFAGIALPGVPYTHKDGPALAVLAQILSHKHLHPEIREKGGAYGAFARFSGLEGLFSMMTYRDPDPGNSIRIFRNSGHWILAQNFTKSDLEEAKISIFKGLDAPASVSMEGMVEFEAGITPELQQQRREGLLDVTIDDVKRVAQGYLIDGVGDGREVVIGPKLPSRAELGWKTVKNLAF